jgi:hypothetical protein
MLTYSVLSLYTLPYMDISNKIPQTDFSRPVTEELLEEIQSRVDSGWRIKTDMELLIKYVRAKLQEENETRCNTDRGVR